MTPRKTLVAAALAALALAGSANASPLEDPLHGYAVQVPLPDGATLCAVGGEALVEAIREQEAEAMVQALVTVAPPGEPCPEAHHP